MAKEKKYTVKLVREREIEIMASSMVEAKALAKEYYISGDACAVLGDVVVSIENIEEVRDDKGNCD